MVDQAGALLALIRAGRARTRRDLLEITGLSRATVSARVDSLVAAGYLAEHGQEAAARGRPSGVLALAEDMGVVLAADLGTSHATLAVCDAGGRPLAHASHALSIADGPAVVLRWVTDRWGEMLARPEVPPARLLGFGVTIPGPVDVAAGRIVHSTPALPGWHEHPIRDDLEAALGVPGLVDNDANAMALGEYHAAWAGSSPVLFVKVATGIGAGMVVLDGPPGTVVAPRLVRGADSASGDIGHVRISSADDGPQCVCGRRGCLAASASGRALARRLAEEGFAVEGSRDVVELALAGEERATALVREAGLLVGDVLATAVSLLNPRVLVLGGDLPHVQDHFGPAVRERLYQRVQPQAARKLQVVESSLGDDAGVLGAARLVLEGVLSAEAVDAALAQRAAAGAR